jgi:hypothetical protein
MNVLACRIVEELKSANHCAVYESDLAHVWPLSVKDREIKIAKFAQEHGFRLRFYKPGLCAIFDKDAGYRNGNAESE